MLTQLPRWARTRAKRMRLRGSSPAMLHYILCSSSEKMRAEIDAVDVAWPPNVIPFRSTASIDSAAQAIRA